VYETRERTLTKGGRSLVISQGKEKKFRSPSSREGRGRDEARRKRRRFELILKGLTVEERISTQVEKGKKRLSQGEGGRCERSGAEDEKNQWGGGVFALKEVQTSCEGEKR